MTIAAPRPHSRSVVGDNEDVKAVGVVIHTDDSNTVIAVEFANPAAAIAAYMALLDAEIAGHLRIAGVLAVHSDAQGKIHVDKMTDHSTKSGVKWGAAGGLVLGVLFPPAIIASTVAWGAVGGALGKLRNIHYRDQTAKQLEGAIGDDHSGIVALVHATDVAKVKQTMPAATKVITVEVDEATAKDIIEAAKEVE
jgi:uncharacterized membrane protein